MSNPLSRIDVNVLPDSYRKRRLQRKQILFLLALVILVALTVPLYQLVSNAMDETAAMERQLDTLDQQVEQRKTKVAERAEKIELINEYETINQKRDILSEDVKAIKSAADEVGIDITLISHGGDNATVSCKGGDLSWDEFRQALDQYCEELIATGRFSSAKRSALSWPLAASITIEIER